ncbi:nitrilase-like protein 2 [Tanacetum coccineum]
MAVRVAAAQMTSINDLAANYVTCSRLVKSGSNVVPGHERILPHVFSATTPHDPTTGAWNMDKVAGATLTGTLPNESTEPYCWSGLVLNITAREELVVPTCVWEDCAIVEHQYEAASAGAKLLCFPENFSFVGAKDGESLKIAEPLDGPIMKGYCALARESNMWLSLGGFQERGSDDAHLCNSHVLIDDAGNIRSTYKKMHLFDVDVPGGAVYKESSFTEAGKEIVSVDSPFGRLGLTVCYDLRFPEVYQQLRFHHGAEVLLVPAAFTKVTGEAHWEVLLRARAIETQLTNSMTWDQVIAAAQGGKHSERRESFGETLIIDPWGTVIGRLPDRASTGIVVADIDFSLIESVRKKMPISQHRKPIEFWKQAVSSSM